MDCYKLIHNNISYDYSARRYDDSLTISLKCDDIDLRELRKIISITTSILSNKRVKKIIFYSPTITFEDKLTYILFECLINTLITDYNKMVAFSCKKSYTSITTAGIKDSLLEKLIKGDITQKEFTSDFYKTCITLEHYRKIIPYDSPDEIFSSVYADVRNFLDNASFWIEVKHTTKIDKEYLNKIAEIVIELASNACEHAAADCLIDIDITSDWKANDGHRVFAINLVVIDFSDVLLGEKLCDKIEKLNVEKNIELSQELLHKYTQVKAAYEYHRQFFNNSYTKEDFFNIASFQNQISCRIKKVTGGTGLPRLLKILLEQTELDLCYMISGYNGIYFDLNNLQFDGDWIGFNSTRNFITDIPDKNVILRQNLFLPGCAFNLNLILKMEE